MKRRLLFFALVFLAGNFPVVAAVAGGQGSLVITPVSVSVRPCMKEAELERQMLTAVNNARAHARTCGRQRCERAGRTKWNSRLARAARLHAMDMAVHQMFSHRGSDGSYMTERLQRAGYRPRAWAENLARGQENVREVVRSWLESPSHCTNIMLPVFGEIGASCIMDRTGRKYWTLMLAAPY